MSVVSVYKNAIKGVVYEVREYNCMKDFVLFVDGNVELDSKSKDECFMKILEMVGDENDCSKK